MKRNEAQKFSPPLPKGFSSSGGDTPFVMKSLEEVVIGTLLSYPDLYGTVDFLTVDDFFFRRHAHLWHIISTLVRESKGFSAQVVQSIYNASNPEAPLTDSALEHLRSRRDQQGLYQAALMLKDARDRRLVASKLQEALAMLERGEMPQVVLNEVLKAQASLYTWSESLDPMDSVVERALQSLRGARYLPTGVRALDEILSGGLPRGGLSVFGARPSMGKTSFARKVVRQVVAQGGHVYWASFDQRAEQILLLEASRELEVPMDTIRRYIEEDRGLAEEVENTLRRIADRWRGHVTFDEAIAPVEVLAQRIRRQHRKRPLDLVVVDYLQFIPVANAKAPDIERVSQVSRTLKSLAMELDVAVFALAQLSREVERRINKMPVNSDLRDSGQVEQDADLILLLHRPGYYSEEEDPELAKIIVSKNKMGPTGVVALRWNASLADYE